VCDLELSARVTACKGWAGGVDVWGDVGGGRVGGGDDPTCNDAAIAGRFFRNSVDYSINFAKMTEALILERERERERQRERERERETQRERERERKRERGEERGCLSEQLHVHMLYEYSLWHSRI